MFQATVFPIYKYLDKLHSMGEQTQPSLYFEKHLGQSNKKEHF